LQHAVFKPCLKPLGHPSDAAHQSLATGNQERPEKAGLAPNLIVLEKAGCQEGAECRSSRVSRRIALTLLTMSLQSRARRDGTELEPQSQEEADVSRPPAFSAAAQAQRAADRRQAARKRRAKQGRHADRSA